MSSCILLVDDDRDYMELLSRKLRAIGYNDLRLVDSPLEAAEAHLHQVFSPVSHLNAVLNSDDLRAAYNECLPLLSAFTTEMGQHQGLFEAIKSLADSDRFAQLNNAQKKSIENRLRDFRLSGIALPPEQKQRFKEIQQAYQILNIK